MGRVENMGKGENADYHYFLHSSVSSIHYMTTGGLWFDLLA